jgi:hypothetical protein
MGEEGIDCNNGTEWPSGLTANVGGVTCAGIEP